MGGTLNVTSTECRKDDECRERDKGIRYMFLQSVWRTAFGAAQYLEAETLQQRRHIMFAVRCGHLRRRPPLPIKLPRVDVPRLVQVLPYLLHHVRLAVQPWQEVAR